MAFPAGAPHDDFRFRALLEAAPDAMVIVSEQGEIALVNAQTENLFEFPRDELIGQSIEVLVPPRLRDLHRLHVRQYVADPQVRPMGAGLRLYGFKKSGHEFPIEVSLSPIKTDDGLLVCAVIRDATEHQRVERELREQSALNAIDLAAANARLRAFIDLALHIASARDMPRLLDFVVVAARRLFAAGCVTLAVFDRDNPMNVEHVATTTDADTTEWARNMSWPTGVLEHVIVDREVIRADNPTGDPQLLGLPAGHPRTAAFLMAPIASPRAAYGWMALTNDHHAGFTSEDVDLITALGGLLGRVYANHYLNNLAERRADALERGEARTRYLLQAAKVGTWDHDYTTNRLALSEVLQQMLGLRLGEFDHTMETFVERVHPEDRQRLKDTIAAATLGGGDYALEVRTNPAYGPLRWLAGAGHVVVDTDRKPLRVVGVAVDETDRKNLEGQYLQSQKMEAMGQLAGGVAHDFNNLLGAILGYAELLLDDLPGGDPHIGDVYEIQKAATTATAVTRQLLAFSRRQIVEPAVVDLSAVIARMRDMLQRLLGEDVSVVLKLDQRLKPLKIDPTQLEQVVMNLCINARDAMPHGGTLTIETAAAAAGFVALRVTDTGTGISMDVREHIFEPFFTTKEPGKGTGLGLATVFGIATQNGGRVELESEAGLGTSFTVMFPEADGADGPPADVDAAPREPRGTETVLIVEDNAGLRDIAQRFLRRLGYTTLVAASAEQAVEIASGRQPIDLMLTDVVMPGTAGPDLAAQLRRTRPQMKVLYMSGYTEEAIVHHGVLKPGIAFIHKPFTQETIGRKIRDVLQGT